MVKAPAKVIDGGRITIPSEARDELNLQEGDYVLVEVERLDV